MSVLDEFVRRVSVDGATLIEEHVKIVLQDKPRWLPKRLWRAVLRRVVAIERHERIHGSPWLPPRP